MKAKINSNCIGCGACQALVPDVFEINDEGVAQIINDNIKEDLLSEVNDAIENCPVGAISINDNENNK